MCYPVPPPYYPAAPVEPGGPPPTGGTTDLNTLDLDELLEHFAVARRSHRDTIRMRDDLDKRARELHTRQEEVRSALLKILRNDLRSEQEELMNRVSGG